MRQPTLFPLTKSSESCHDETDKKYSVPPEKSSFMEELNSSQREAVTTTHGPVLVIAGAGSGKTRTLVCRLVHLVENGISPDSILLLTFTRKAAHEMVARAANLLGDSCQRVMGGTFHSVANFLLRKYAHYAGFASNFTILDRADAEGIINLLKSSLGLTGAGKRFPSKRVILNIISGAVNKSLPFDELVASQYFHLTEYIDDLKKIRDHYIQFKRDHGLMDYDDLLVHFHSVLADNPHVRQEVSDRFRYIMVDEYQDTNHIQAAIIKLIAADHQNIMVVGDDSQSIYSFRGADFRNIMDFPEVYPGTKIIRLEQNYRSSQEILEATNAIIAQAQEKYTKKLFSTLSGGERPLLYGAKDEREQARYVTKMIMNRHEQGTPYHEMAVLFRSGFHSYKLELELTNRQIHFEKRGGLKLTETAHIKDVISYLRLASNDGDSLSWNRVFLQLPKVGPKTAQKIVATLREESDPLIALKKYKAAPAWRQNFQELVAMLHDIGQNSSPLVKFERIMEYYEPVFEKLYADDYPNRSRDLEQLKAIIGDYSDVQSFLDDTALDPPESSIDVLDTSEKDTLVLSTVHSSKGLEWDTVFVIHLADGKFPSSHAAIFPEQLEEERRLLYVAATRAKSRLYLTYPRETIAPDRSRHYSTLSPFLSDLPQGLILSPRSGYGGGYESSTYSGKRAVFHTPSHVSQEKKKNTGSGEKITSTKLLDVGAAVKHGFFGTGHVKNIKGDKTVEVYFSRHGKKTLRLDYAKLELA